MQSSSLASSSSVPLHTSKKPRLRTSTLKLQPLRLSNSSKSITLPSLNGGAASVSSRKSSSLLISSSVSASRFNPWSSLPSRISDVRSGVDVRTMAAKTEGAGEESSSVMKTVQLGSLFGLWYLFNIYYNIYIKQVLKVFPYPFTLTMVQFGVGSVLILLMWWLNLYSKPKVNGAQLTAILPLAVVHVLANLFTNVSLGKVSVSFTHTIKATEPFFTVILSTMFLGEVPTLWVVSSLVPIIGGVVLASATEASFNWPGFWSAMASNLTNQARNVLSKKLMVKKEDSLDNITLFSVITIMSLFLMAPFAIFMEGVKFTPAYLQSAGLNIQDVYIRSLLAALCFHAYQQVSYMILQKVSPVTHSVGNCLKRVVVIVSSVIFFKTPVTLVNSIGTGIALAGVFMYSRVKGIKPKPKTA